MNVFSLLLMVISVLVSILGTYFSWKLYKSKRISDSMICVVAAFAITVIRRMIVLLASLGYFTEVDANIVRIDSIIFLASVVLYTYGLWGILKGFGLAGPAKKKRGRK